MGFKWLRSDSTLVGGAGGGSPHEGRGILENFTQFFKRKNENFYENVAKELRSFHFFLDSFAVLSKSNRKSEIQKNVRGFSRFSKIICEAG